MLIDLVVWAEVGLCCADELVSQGLGLLKGAAGNLLPILEDNDKQVYGSLSHIQH